MVTLTKEQDELLAALGRFQGRSKGSYLREMMDGAEPMFRALLPSLRTLAAQMEGQPIAIRDAVASVITGAYGPDAAPLLDHIELISALDAEARTTASVASEERDTAPRRKSRR